MPSSFHTVLSVCMTQRSASYVAAMTRQIPRKQTSIVGIVCDVHRHMEAGLLSRLHIKYLVKMFNACQMATRSVDICMLKSCQLVKIGNPVLRATTTRRSAPSSASTGRSSTV